MILVLSLIHLAVSALAANAEANIAVQPITDVDVAAKTGYFSDPFHVPYENNQGIYKAGTTQKYLECKTDLEPNAAGIHPFQSGSGPSRTWDAIVTLHIQNTSDCDGITGWNVIVHARPADTSAIDVPPKAWIGDQLLIGSFSHAEDANYDGKYFRTPAGQLYLVYSKQQSPKPKKRDGVAAWPMDDPRTKTPGSQPTFLLVPDDDLNSENYIGGEDDFKLIETGNIRAINGKFVMAYSVGAYFKKTYKLGVAYSDTFLPSQQGSKPQYYRKVLKDNPDHLWGSSRPKEVHYLLQSNENHAGWRYIGDRVLAPGVPTVTRIGLNNGWVLSFAGYNPDDAPMEHNTTRFVGNHRRPFYIDLEVNVPVNPSVKHARDAELQKWIVPAHK